MEAKGHNPETVLKAAVIGDRETLPLFRGLGFHVEEATEDSEVIRALNRIATEGGYAFVLVYKHVISDEDAVRREAEKLGIPILILPTRWAPAEPVDVNKLIAKALGFG